MLQDSGLFREDLLNRVGRIVTDAKLLGPCPFKDGPNAPEDAPRQMELCVKVAYFDWRGPSLCRHVLSLLDRHCAAIGKRKPPTDKTSRSALHSQHRPRSCGLPGSSQNSGWTLLNSTRPSVKKSTENAINHECRVSPSVPPMSRGIGNSTAQ